MKSYLLLTFVFTVILGLSHGLNNTPLSNVRRSGLVGQRSPLYASQRYGIAGRPEYSETYHEETGNLYGGQRDGRLITRDSGDNLRGLQYASRPNRDYSGSRGQQLGNLYNQQQPRFQDGNRRSDLGYGAGRGQIAFSAPLANTRSYSPRYDVTGNQNLGFY